MENNYLNPNPLKSPVLQILGILLRLVGFFFIGAALTFGMFSLLLGISVEMLQEIVSHPTADSKLLIWGFQGLSHLLMFIALPLLYVYYFNKNLTPKFFLRSDNLGIYTLIAVLIFFSAIPLTSWLIELNKSIQLPSWAESKEIDLKKLTEILAYYNNTPEFFIALLVIAILPALGEEILFRGIIQNEFFAILKNPHAAIWVTGFLFSFIHFQFFGFFPRMLLGVLFGYLYYWSGNLVIPILIHFINNALTLIVMNLYKNKIIDTDFESEPMPAISILISIIIFTFLLFTFRRLHKQRKQIDH
jgi:uncharacterized protein